MRTANTPASPVVKNRLQRIYCRRNTELMPEALESFAEILNELQARGDKTKLMQLFGH
jgi:hypothetical protein